MTRKENLQRVLRGETPIWVPFAPNFNQWFVHHKKNGTLPPEIAEGDYLDAMIVLDCDIFSRNVSGGFVDTFTGFEPIVTRTEEVIGPRSTTTYNTPYGSLRFVSQRIEAISSYHTMEYPVKDWARDGAAAMWLLEHREFTWDEEVFQQTNARIGEYGILNVPVMGSPLYALHHALGLDGACYFVMDEPEAAKKYCELYWEKARPLLSRLAKHPDVESVIMMENVDSPFYSPSVVADYWTPYIKEAATLLRENGKYLFVHACGQLAGLADVFAESRVSGLEGVSHAPLGDWNIEGAKNCHPDFIFVGGFSANEQESLSAAEVREFYNSYLPASEKERIIIASSCQTAISTPWERIKLVRDICREWGGYPADAQELRLAQNL